MKKTSEKYDVDLLGIHVYSEETNYEQSSFCGIPLGKRRKVSKKSKILPMSKETRDAVVDVGGAIIKGVVAKKLLK